MLASTSSTNCWPEAPDITVNETTVEIEDATGLWVVDQFIKVAAGGKLGSSDGGTTFTLSETPLDDSTMVVSKSGLILSPDEYALTGTSLALDVPLQSDEELVVHYVSTTT